MYSTDEAITEATEQSTVATATVIENIKAHVISTTDSLSIIYYLIGSIGFLGNLLVVVVIFHYTAMRKSLTNRYIINQSIVDAAAALALILTTIFEEENGQGLDATGKLLYCKFWLTKTLSWALFLSSTYNLVWLSIERYVAVVHPLKHKTFFSKTVVILSMAFIWSIGLIFNLGLKVPTSYVKDGVCQSMRKWPSAEVQKGTGVFIIFLQFFVPLGIIGFCYGRMAIVLRNRVKPGDGSDQAQAPGASRNQRSEDSTNKARRNIFKTLVVVSVCFVFCWVWNQAYLFLFNISVIKIDFTSNYYHFSVIAVFLNCCVNPLIYIIHYDQFRKGLKKFRVSKVFNCLRNEESSNSTSLESRKTTNDQV